MAVLFIAVLMVSPLSEFFAVEVPPPSVMLLVLGLVAISHLLMRVGRAAIERWTHRTIP
jgi:hypothetical protein